MIEAAEIFRGHFEEYNKKYKLPEYIMKAINAIKNCRTQVLGGHVCKCEACGEEISLYNSCRNRNCPKCQIEAREKWIEERKKTILPIEHFHVVFTVPHELNSIFQMNKKTMYGILFKAASETLLELGKDPKHLGAELGFFLVLHTWGQNLCDHYHVHAVVTAGGLSPNGKEWIDTKKENFFVPVKVISELFKKKFMAYFYKEKSKGKIKFDNKNEKLNGWRKFLNFKEDLYKKNWVVHCEPPFGGTEHVIEYLGRYTHRVAIANSRIISVGNEKVSFKWKDYSDGNKEKIMTIAAEEFMRRFLLHILPEGFVKIRYYGIMSNKNLKTKLEKSREILEHGNLSKKKTEHIDLLEKTEFKLQPICPCCKGGKLIPVLTLYPLLKKGP